MCKNELRTDERSHHTLLLIFNTKLMIKAIEFEIPLIKSVGDLSINIPAKLNEDQNLLLRGESGEEVSSNFSFLLDSQ